MKRILTQLKNKYVDHFGYHTDRKLVVIESDDWGSIRMPSREVFERLKATGDTPEKDPFLSNDSLECEEDLQVLFDLLGSVFDQKGNHPIITANFAMANPDFDEIDYNNGIYHYEPFYRTYDRYFGNKNVLELVKEGHRAGFMLPQLHCREHLNVNRWMRDLRAGKEDTRLAFENKTIGIGASFEKKNLFGYMDAFNTDCTTAEELDKLLQDAHDIFSDSFGFRSDSFVASCFVWDDGLEKSLIKQGIQHIQSSPWQYKPVGKHYEYKLRRALRYTGQKGKFGHLYSVRNCVYEPAYNQNPQDCVKNCFEAVQHSFAVKKPAIISSHRLNYVSAINPQNRENNLLGLKALLKAILLNYPDAEFISSAELFAIMERH